MQIRTILKVEAGIGRVDYRSELGSAISMFVVSDSQTHDHIP